MKEQTYETFYSEVLNHNGTLRITIPHKLAKFTKIKTGDTIKAMIKKQPDEEK